MKRLWLIFKQELSMPAKVAIIAGLLLALIGASVAAGALASHLKDNAFAKRESDRQSAREQLQRERDEAIGRAEAAEKREQDLAAKVTVSEAVIAAAGQKAEAAATKLEEENQRYETEMRAFGNSVDPDERCKRICARLAKLYPGAACACKEPGQ